MNKEITTIYFDLGGTLRVPEKDPAYVAECKARMAKLAGTDMDPEKFYKLINARYDEYRDWVLTYFCEAPEKYLWTRWLTPSPEFDAKTILENYPKLTYEWRQIKAKGRRVMAPGAVETIKELHRRGYKLGIISDLVGCYEVDNWLNEDGLRPYFMTVQQSSICYIRKPHPAIYYYALEETNTEPGNACYVGDNLQRDIMGAKATNFGMTLAVEYGDPIHPTEEQMPDGKINAMTDLLDIFPEGGKVNEDKIKKVK